MSVGRTEKVTEMGLEQHGKDVQELKTERMRPGVEVIREGEGSREIRERSCGA